MYIRRTIRRMMNMKKSTWRFISVCFVMSYIYLAAAAFMLFTAQGEIGSAAVLRNAVELARMPQAIFIICAIGSVVIEEQSMKQD